MKKPIKLGVAMEVLAFVLFMAMSYVNRSTWGTDKPDWWGTFPLMMLVVVLFIAGWCCILMPLMNNPKNMLTGDDRS